jgi:hypothetical protein
MKTLIAALDEIPIVTHATLKCTSRVGRREHPANRLPMLTKARFARVSRILEDHPGDVHGWRRDRWRARSRDLSWSTTTHPRM